MKSINSALHNIVESMEKSAPQDHGIILEKEKPHKFPSLPTKKKRDPSSRRVGVGSENHKYYAKIDVLEEDEQPYIIEEHAQIDDEAIYDVPPVNNDNDVDANNNWIALVLSGAQ